MFVLALAIVNCDNQAVFLRTRRDSDENAMGEEESMNLICNLNAALDIVEERQNQAQNKDPYLGVLNQSENHKIFGLLSATKTKILLMVATNVGVMFRDTEARNTLKQLYSVYTDVVTYNPFCCPEGEVRSKKLEELVSGIFGISVDYAR